jgi:hypothetical protein
MSEKPQRARPGVKACCAEHPELPDVVCSLVDGHEGHPHSGYQFQETKLEPIKWGGDVLEVPTTDFKVIEWT